MLQWNGSVIACAQRLKKDDLPIGLENTLHLFHPFLQVLPPSLRMPNHEIGDAPTRDNQIGTMIWNRKLTMIRYINLPIGEATPKEPFTTNAQHLCRNVKCSNGSY